MIRTDTLGEMLDVASLLADQPLPAGRRVAIVTNAGGPGIMCADACEAAGLEVPSLPDDDRSTSCAAFSRRGLGWQSGGHDRDGDRRALRASDRRARRVATASTR